MIRKLRWISIHGTVLVGALIAVSFGLAPAATVTKTLSKADLTLKGAPLTLAPPASPETSNFTFQKDASAGESLRIDGTGRATCIGRRISAAEAYKRFSNYAAIYLALCNPPAKK